MGKFAIHPTLIHDNDNEAKDSFIIECQQKRASITV